MAEQTSAGETQGGLGSGVGGVGPGGGTGLGGTGGTGGTGAGLTTGSCSAVVVTVMVAIAVARALDDE